MAKYNTKTLKSQDRIFNFVIFFRRIDDAMPRIPQINYVFAYSVAPGSTRNRNCGPDKI